MAVWILCNNTLKPIAVLDIKGHYFNFKRRTPFLKYLFSIVKIVLKINYYLLDILTRKYIFLTKKKDAKALKIHKQKHFLLLLFYVSYFYFHGNE